jgi:hypothetical protein
VTLQSLAKSNTLWHVDLLLGNDHEVSSYTTANAKYWLCKERLFLGSGRIRHAIIEELLEAVFSVQSMPRLYSEGKSTERESERLTSQLKVNSGQRSAQAMECID